MMHPIDAPTVCPDPQRTLAGRNALQKTAPSGGRRGQSLVEFVLVTPLLLLLMVTGSTMAYGIYQANLVSNAIQQPAIEKLTYAQMDGAVSPAALQATINTKGVRSNISPATLVDAVTIVASDPYTAIIMGTKNFTPSVGFLPTFRIRAGQVINNNLLLPANAGSAVAHPVTAWVPGDTPVPPPW